MLTKHYPLTSRTNSQSASVGAGAGAGAGAGVEWWYRCRGGWCYVTRGQFNIPKGLAMLLQLMLLHLMLLQVLR
jgi:hypothetical protein